MHMHSHDKNCNSHYLSGEKNLLISIFINIIITVSEIIGGLFSGSLALLSDAFHNLSDVFSMIISYFAIQIGKKAKHAGKSYGYKRAEIIAAVFNVITLFAVCFYIAYEALMRFLNPKTVDAGLMAWIALIGLTGNFISVLLLFKSSKYNINIKSAFLHLLGDTFSSVGVIITSIVLIFYPIYILDSIISVIIIIYIVKESWDILMESLNILMQGSPKHIKKDNLVNRLIKDKRLNIKGVHHVHIWEITPGKIIFDAHIIVSKKDLQEADNIIKGINIILNKEFGISHSTIQLESEDFNHCINCDI